MTKTRAGAPSDARSQWQAGLMSNPTDDDVRIPRRLDGLAALTLFTGLLEATHLTAPADLAAAAAEHARRAGADDVALYLVDHEHRHLVPVPPFPDDGARATGESAIDGTVVGRCFASSTILQLPAKEPEQRRLWLPLLDGIERLGVLSLTFPAAPGGVAEADVAVWERYAHLIAQLVVSKGAYGDVFELVRRRRPMSLGGELQWAQLPPLTFASHELVVAAMLEPCYDDGGDAFDYAVNETTSHFAIIDAVGHGLAASGTASFALAAYRQARRAGRDLAGTYAVMDAALAELYGGERYATAVLAELDWRTGALSWVSAGHPEPLLMRDGRRVKSLAVPPATPLGMPFVTGPVEVQHEQLQPGDSVLLFTDGLPEARQPDGSFLGVGRLAEFLERASAAGYAAPETLRRLRLAVLQHQDGVLQDDASALLVQWRGGGERALLPQTVESDSPPAP
jgi:hypothetical protein